MGQNKMARGVLFLALCLSLCSNSLAQDVLPAQCTGGYENTNLYSDKEQDEQNTTATSAVACAIACADYASNNPPWARSTSEEYDNPLAGCNLWVYCTDECNDGNDNTVPKGTCTLKRMPLSVTQPIKDGLKIGKIPETPPPELTVADSAANENWQSGFCLNANDELPRECSAGYDNTFIYYPEEQSLSQTEASSDVACATLCAENAANQPPWARKGSKMYDATLSGCNVWKYCTGIQCCTGGIECEVGDREEVKDRYTVPKGTCILTRLLSSEPLQTILDTGKIPSTVPPLLTVATVTANENWKSGFCNVRPTCNNRPEIDCVGECGGAGHCSSCGGFPFGCAGACCPS